MGRFRSAKPPPSELLMLLLLYVRLRTLVVLVWELVELSPRVYDAEEPPEGDNGGGMLPPNGLRLFRWNRFGCAADAGDKMEPLLLLLLLLLLLVLPAGE